MLLRKIPMKCLRKRNHKKEGKPANTLTLGKKGRLGFSLYMAAVLCTCLFTTTAFAASDPLGVVNNLSSFIFSLIRAIGSSFWAGAWCRWACPFRAMTPAKGRKEL